MNRKTGIAIACACLLTACSARETPKDRNVFLQEGATVVSYSQDLAACDIYMPEDGPTIRDRNAYAGAHGVSGGGSGIGGGIATVLTEQGYKDTRKDMFDECMYFKGYRLISLPKGYGPQPDSSGKGRFNWRKAAVDMIKNNEVEELIIWENAKNSGNKEAIEGYLRTYPAGSFATDANGLLTGNSVTKTKAAK